LTEGIRRVSATSDNTAYALQASPSPFGTLPSAISFIRKTLGDILNQKKKRLQT